MPATVGFDDQHFAVRSRRSSVARGAAKVEAGAGHGWQLLAISHCCVHARSKSERCDVVWFMRPVTVDQGVEAIQTIAPKKTTVTGAQASTCAVGQRRNALIAPQAICERAPRRIVHNGCILLLGEPQSPVRRSAVQVCTPLLGGVHSWTMTVFVLRHRLTPAISTRIWATPTRSSSMFEIPLPSITATSCFQLRFASRPPTSCDGATLRRRIGRSSSIACTG